MPYVPHTAEDRREMLQTIGVDSIDDLFCEIPENLRIRGELNLPPALDEPRLLGHLGDIAKKNVNLADVTCYLGAGIYDRYIPASVAAVISRGEFLTAYTPYQPEASQGALQTIYEFQTMVAELYGMDIANASMYDGATSMAEAALVAHASNGRKKVVVCEAVHPHYRQVLDTYCWSMGLEVDTLTCVTGVTDNFDRLTEGAACLIVQYPNFLGSVGNLDAARDAARSVGAMFIVVADPVACALLPPPGEFDADIVVGEGQPMGIAMGLGGPVLGLFACKHEFVRRLPGRVVGRTTEIHGGRSGYVMTLRTREQDIRREKATSNICTNEALMALAATVYMAALGKNGMRSVAETSVRNAQYAIKRLTEAGASLKFKHKVFDEFALDVGRDAAQVRDKLLKKGILAGLPLGPYYRGLESCLLVAVTEMRTKDEIDRFAVVLKEAMA